MASVRGSTSNSAGIKGKTAAPSGTSDSGSSAILAPRHRGNDAQFIAIFHGGPQAVEVADVFIVKINVDKPADLALVEKPLGDRGEFLPEIIQHGLDGCPGCLDNGVSLRVLPHGSGNMNPDRHRFLLFEIRRRLRL